MSSISFKKPTTGFVVAVLALVLALGGTAVAAQSGAGDGDAQSAPALTKKQIKKIAKKQANKIVTQRAPGLTVAKAVTADTAGKATLADVATNALNAQNAVNAAQVGGLDVKKFNASVPTGAGSTVALATAGLNLTLTCAGGVPQLGATSAVPGSKIRAVSVDDGEVVYTNGTSDLSTFGTLATIPGTTADWGSGFVEYTVDGKNVNVWFGYRVDGGTCFVYGNYISG